jgi:uncharacterized protein with FMN-binding domain
MSMKKFLSSAAFILIFGIYTIYHYFGGSPAEASLSPQAPASEPVSTSGSQEAKSQYSDGVYIGSVADAYYGNIQVEAKISNGKISDVSFLQYPDDQSTSRFINGQAMPLLKQEAIQTQSTSVDTISGATDTSAAFRQSLSSALNKARNS